MNEFVRPLTGEAPSVQQTLNSARVPAPSVHEWVPQRETADCGAAALAARPAGLRLTREQVAGVLDADGRGASLEALARAAARLGLRAVAVQVAPAMLDRVRPPAVVHLDGGQYVALLACTAGQVVLGDPSCGILTVPTERFARTGSGAVLLLTSASC